MWMKGNYAGHQKECLEGRYSSSAGIVGCAVEGRSFFLGTPWLIFGGQYGYGLGGLVKRSL
eukprot:703664-Pelagomonas_calceolata.AAC.1